MGGGFSREGARAYLWPVRVAAWQKPLKYCKVLILQLKEIIFFFKKRITPAWDTGTNSSPENHCFSS